MKFDKEISKEQSIAKNPTESGWYVCSVKINSFTSYDETKPTLSVNYEIVDYEPRLLYWESNVWIVHPRSYKTVDEKDIISWMKVPDDYFQTIKVNYLTNP